MQITIMRRPSAHGCTLSVWYIDGHQQCYGLEDIVRGPTEQKVFGQTAIPAGTYQVLVTMSNRFQRLLPLLTDLPGQRTLFGSLPIGDCGVRIHPGNYARDTEGCLLPGMSLGADQASVLNSRIAFAGLFAKIQAAVAAGEMIKLSIA